ncbi:uncharacterized protein LOC130712715 [Lotus japonicus]|uniref:uncharacterized protein LOC130712698 n=1 Tax=Lotus japonicus TaxID=34305 RepID=UPI0025869494|nr:uncharacterized protein LOC130712698 [Lotus japonicus]XP_057418520.1 uncharacterized protein LOC130712715 [Lotus japonicus]
MSARVSNVSGAAGGPSPEERDLHRRNTYKAAEDDTGGVPLRKPISYKDICSGINGKTSLQEEEEPLDYAGSGSDMEDEDEGEENEVDMEPREIDPLCPVIKITKQELREARSPWKKAVIVQLLGKKMGLGFMRTRLQNLWQPLGSMEIIDLAHGYFVVRFNNLEDYQHVFDGGPWVILGHCLVVQQWKPEFIPATAEPGKVAVWIRIPDFPVEYYGKHFLWRIGESIGRMIKIDAHSIRREHEDGTVVGGSGRGSFVRLCVEVDLRKTLIAKFEFHDLVYKVEYEGLNQICFHCGRFGHRLDNCSLLAAVPGTAGMEEKEGPRVRPEAEESQPFGEWMIVKRPQRKAPIPAHKKGNQAWNSGQSSKNSGSRFSALANGSNDMVGPSHSRSDTQKGNSEVIAINDDVETVTDPNKSGNVNKEDMGKVTTNQEQPTNSVEDTTMQHVGPTKPLTNICCT